MQRSRRPLRSRMHQSGPSFRREGESVAKRPTKSQAVHEPLAKRGLGAQHQPPFAKCGKSVKLFAHGTKVFSLIQKHIHANIPKDIWRACPLQPDILNLSGKREKACLPAGFSALERRSPCRLCRRPSPFDPGGTEPKPPLQVPHFQPDATVSNATPANPVGSGVCRSLPPGGRGVPALAALGPSAPSPHRTFLSPQRATSQQNPCRLQRAPLPSCA
jgi:hypothetical protein